jgi:hypothetical protein
MTASSAPGSVTDPLVSKAYVDAQLEDLKRWVLSREPGAQPAQPAVNTADLISAAIGYLEAEYGLSNRDGASGKNTDAYEIIFMETGKLLFADAGAQIILRGGSATAISGVNGLCDVTSGVDVLNGMDIPLNHLLIVPASDGRGLTVTRDAYLMLKGTYRIHG